MTLTETIYNELMDGLGKGLDWQQFLPKYSASKGPLYNALSRVLTEVSAKITALNEERKQVQRELEEAKLTLDELDQKIREAETTIVALETRQNALKEEIKALETRLTEKSEFARHLTELESLGFNTERLRQLQDALIEIGGKYGFKGKQAVAKFFNDLKDYGPVLWAELELEGLQTQIETKKLEAENWQAKEEAIRRKHDDLKESIGAVHALRSRGIKVSQILTWHRIVNQFETVEQFEETLAQYADITKLLNARKEEAKRCEIKLAEIQSQVETLKREEAEIKAAIEAVKLAGVKALKAMTEAAEKQLKAVASKEIREIQAVGEEGKRQLNDYSNQLDLLVRKMFEAGQECERINQELHRYQGVKEVLESHTTASEGAK